MLAGNGPDARSDAGRDRSRTGRKANARKPEGTREKPVADDLISARLLHRIERDFPDADAARGILGALREPATELADSRQDTGRLLAAAVLIAAGDVDRFRSAVRLAGQDWRDLLVSGGVGNANWRDVLDEELGPR